MADSLSLLVMIPTQVASAAPRSKPDGGCSAWSVRTLVSGQGWLENLAFDGSGSISISALSQGRLLKLTHKEENYLRFCRPCPHRGARAGEATCSISTPGTRCR